MDARLSNIIKKAIPEPKGDGIEGIGLYPRSLSIPGDDNFQRWMLT